MTTRATAPVNVGGITITAREITLADARAWLAGLEKVDDAVSPVDGSVFEEFSVDDLYRMSDLTREKAAGLTLVELRAVYDACKKLNVDFFAYRSRLFGQVRSIAPDLGAPSSGS